MHINTLYIDDYKLLKKFEIRFQKNVSIFIGINGSGKSTVLECIAQIFSDAFLKEKSRFGFRIEYEFLFNEVLAQGALFADTRIDIVKVEITSLSKGDKLSYKVYFGDEIIENESDIKQRFGSFEKILPSNIVIYYSGLSAHMEALCGKHEKIQKDAIQKVNTLAKRPFFYFKPQNFKMLLLALLSYEYGENKKFVFESLKISGLSSFSIILKRPNLPWAKGKKAKEIWGANYKMADFATLLRRFANEVLVTDDDNSIEFNFSSIESLYGIKNYLGQETKLFELLDLALYEDLLGEINITLTKAISQDHEAPQNVDTYFNSERISEGELQKIIIKGINENLIQQNTLLLFDEPDTYLHPTWQSGFISEIQKYAEWAHFLITTHSPQLLSNANQLYSELFILKNGSLKDGSSKYFGRDINNILYNQMDATYRNADITILMDELFKAIALNNLKEAEPLYFKLIEILGDDYPKMIAAKSEIDYLKFDSNEVD